MRQRLLPIALLASSGWWSPAQAERAVRVVAEGTPFAAEELAAALRVRLPAEGVPVEVNASASTDDRITVAIGDTTREVALGGTRGPAAARLVALAVVDLTLDDVAAVPPDPPRARTFAIAALGSATAWTGVLAGASGDVVLVRDRWLGAAELGAGGRVAGDLHVTAVHARLCGGTRRGMIELRAGVALASTWVSDGAGDQLTMVGLTASARLHLGTRYLLAIGADGYTTQTTYTLGTATITTPWVAPWVAAGVELAP